MNNKYNDIAYLIEGEKIKKAIYIDNIKTLFQVECCNDNLMITILNDEVTEVIRQGIKNYVINWFDLNTDIAPFYELLSNNSKTKGMLRDCYGLRLIGYPDLYEVLCWCIIGQVINLSFAHKIKRSLVEKYGESIFYQGKLFYLFPKAEIIANLTKDELVALQLSVAKADSLINLSKRFASQEINQEQLGTLPTLQDKQKTLLETKGVGIWTVNYALLKCFRETACIPYGDAVLIKKLMSNKIMTHKNDKIGINQFYKSFKGWAHYLTFYFWNSDTSDIK